MHKTAPSGAVDVGVLQAPPMRDNQPTMPTLPPLPLLTCPLCGRSNQCAVSTGGMAADCWCMHTPFSPDARTALAALPDAQRGQVCICPACAAGGAPALAHRSAPI